MAAAGITGIVVALVADAASPAQLGIFAVARLRRGLSPAGAIMPAIRCRAATPSSTSAPPRLIGQTVTVETAIENGKGRVKVGDGVWNARGPGSAGGRARCVDRRRRRHLPDVS